MCTEHVNQVHHRFRYKCNIDRCEFIHITPSAIKKHVIKVIFQNIPIAALVSGGKPLIPS